jgi:hypothetical protein
MTKKTAKKVRIEIQRLAKSPDPRVQKFIASMWERYPGVRR